MGGEQDKAEGEDSEGDRKRERGIIGLTNFKGRKKRRPFV